MNIKADLVLTAVYDVLERIASGEKVEEYRDDTDYYFNKFYNLDRKGDAVSYKDIKTITLHDRHFHHVTFSVKDLFFCTFEETPLPDELKELESDSKFTGCYVIQVDKVLDVKLKK